MIERYIDFHKRAVFKLFKNSILFFDKGMFSALFNVFSSIYRRSIRFEYNKGRDVFIASDGTERIYFKNKVQAFNAYHGGLKKRSQDIGDIYFLDRIDFQENDVVVDCGANVGDLGLYFRSNNLQVRYIGFEPSPDECHCLRLNMPSSVINMKGLWKESGTLELFVSSDGADSSFIAPKSYDSIIEIPVVRLDEVIDGDTKIRLLKLEAEGAEPEVLSGLKKILEQVDYISADLGYERGVEQQSTLTPVTNFLINNGFELMDMSHDRIVALFVRRNLLRSQKT